MSVLLGKSVLETQSPVLASYPLMAGTQIDEGDFVGIHRGYARQLVAGDQFGGVAYDSVDNGTGNADDKMIRVARGAFEYACSWNADSRDNERAIYATDHQTLAWRGHTRVGTQSTVLGKNRILVLPEGSFGLIERALTGVNPDAAEEPLTFSSPLARAANTVSLDYNATNLQLTTNALNTIQDIATASSPTFAALTLSGALNANTVACASHAAGVSDILTLQGQSSADAVENLRLQFNPNYVTMNSTTGVSLWVFSGIGIKENDDAQLTLGTSSNNVLMHGTAQTNDCLLLGLDSTASDQTSRTLIVCDVGDITYNFAHAAQTNPTLFIHSAAQSTTQWLSLAHDGTDAVLNAGAGVLRLNSANFWGAGGVGAGTLTNAPAAGNPTTWLQLKDNNGNTVQVPAW